MTSTQPAPTAAEFTPEQKEYLAGLMAGIAQYRKISGETQGERNGASGGTKDAGTRDESPRTAQVFGTPFDEVTKQERWKHQEHPLDGWDRILAHAHAGQFPNEEDTFRFRSFGLFYVAPAQDSFMLRCRIPAGELTAAQLRGLADLADRFGDGKAAITTRSNIQIRQIKPQNLVDVLTQLQSLGLTAKGSGVDNVRNITASPTAGIDNDELIDPRPYAHALHHYILNQRDLYNLPRKFNVAFEGGGAIDTVANSNDIGFMAVRVPAPDSGVSLRDGSSVDLGSEVFFRVELAGISGHKQLATDSGIVVKPAEAVAVAAAMLRVFIEFGDRTDRKKARLKYLIDRWGMPRFLEETQKKLAFALVQFPLTRCAQRRAPIAHGHVGIYRQKQKGRNYVGVAIPVGIMQSRQMRRLADLTQHYGSGSIRLTPWQNLLLPDIPDGYVETIKRQLVRIGFHYEASNIAAGLVACTGRMGCKYAATDTKGHAVALAEHLNRRLHLDLPINIHLTGCPNSCAQHYIGDIGLQGVKVGIGAASVEGYNVVFGGGVGIKAQIGREVFKGISFAELPELLERVLRVYLEKRATGETFSAFANRHELKQLQEMFSS